MLFRNLRLILSSRYSFPKKEGKSPVGKSPAGNSSHHFYLCGIFTYVAFLPMWHFYLCGIFTWDIFTWDIFTYGHFTWGIFTWGIFTWGIFTWGIFTWGIFTECLGICYMLNVCSVHVVPSPQPNSGDLDYPLWDNTEQSRGWRRKEYEQHPISKQLYSSKGVMRKS